MDDLDLKNIIDDIEYLASEKNSRMILNILVGNHPADIAEILGNLSEENEKYVFGLFDADTASDVIVELDDVTREKLVSELQHERISEIVDEMESDDATDLVAELPDEVAEKVLDAIDEEGSEEVKELLQHDEDTAGGIMALEYVAVSEDTTVDEAIKEIRAKAEEVPEVYNVYVFDKDGMLAGFLPLKNLIVAQASQKIKDVLIADVISVPIEMDQEEVANIFRRYNLVSLPVVDELGKLVGRITVDDIVEVIEEEASEDIQKMAGIADEEEIRETSVFKISFGRLPWLLVGFVGQLIAALVLSQFEASLRDIFLAIFFIPMMMAMGGNSGIQAATIVVRGIALGELSPDDTFKRLSREIKVSLFNGAVCGLLLFGIIAVFDTPTFGFVLALSMLAVIINASILGASIPLILRKVGVDPAIAAGPLITTFNDIIGLAIYLGLVTAALQFL
ncbi:magnesium transporter [candidate division KSB1 bacterium]|nr:magnesium transporter [candidate division KSB1 bacterium]MCH7754855.1 magnesium transporter [candidate division KSB1 bacterium]